MLCASATSRKMALSWGQGCKRRVLLNLDARAKVIKEVCTVILNHCVCCSVFVVYTSGHHGLISFPNVTDPFQSSMNKCHTLCFLVMELTSVPSEDTTIS